MPVSRPAAAIAGISIHDWYCTFGLAASSPGRRPGRQRRPAEPTPAPGTRTGRTAPQSGQTSGCPRWVTGAATATARLDVISAVPSARGCHVPNRMRAANTAPPSGTLYTAPRPAPAAQASRISRSRAVSANRDVPRSPNAAASWRGAPSRPSDAPVPTSRTCSMASIDIASRGIGRCAAMVADSAGTSTDAGAATSRSPPGHRRSSGRPPVGSRCCPRRRSAVSRRCSGR